MIAPTGGGPVAHRDDRFDMAANPPFRERERMSIATSLAGLALVLGAIASIQVPAEDQALQGLVFGFVLGAAYAVTALGGRVFEFRVLAPGLWLLLATSSVLWFVTLKHQFAFASMTAFVVGQGLCAGFAILLRDKPWWTGVLLPAFTGLTVEWLLFAYADPRIVLLTRIEGTDADRLMGSETTLAAALAAAAATAVRLTRQDARSRPS
ncbi:MAG: hypothetical protein FJX20_02085 [Alphaproteobacteria bacterium]|nr:hypothetical protein [Alphaproteobacteria bacterium]